VKYTYKLTGTIDLFCVKSAVKPQPTNRDNNKLECGPVLNMMAALPNMPQSLANAHY